MADILNEKTEEEQWKTLVALQKVKLGVARRKIYGIADVSEIPETWDKLYQETYDKTPSEMRPRLRAEAWANLGGESYEEALSNGQVLARSYAIADGVEDYKYQGILDQVDNILPKISTVNNLIGSIKSKPTKEKPGETKKKKKKRFLFF